MDSVEEKLRAGTAGRVLLRNCRVLDPEAGALTVPVAVEFEGGKVGTQPCRGWVSAGTETPPEFPEIQLPDCPGIQLLVPSLPPQCRRSYVERLSYSRRRSFVRVYEWQLTMCRFC